MQCVCGNIYHSFYLCYIPCDHCGNNLYMSCGSCNKDNCCYICYKTKGPKAPVRPLPHKWFCNKCKISYNTLKIFRYHMCK